jgi:hypothetical protein
LNVAARDGSFVPIDLGEIAVDGVIGARLPASARGGLVVGLAFAQTLPEEHNGRPALGTLVLDRVTVSGASGSRGVAVDFGTWRGVGGIRPRVLGARVRLAYVLTADVDSAFRPRQPTDGSPISVIASPTLAALAGPRGLLPLRFSDVGLVVRIVRVAKRFPSVYGPFVVADRGSLSTALNSSAPGTAVVDEVWLDGVSRRGRLVDALGKPPFVGVHASFRADVERRLRSDALARAVLWTLAGVGAVGFGLALLGLALSLSADLRDERRDLFDLETQGVGPAALRRHLRLRAGFVLVIGVAGGLVLGAALSALVVAVVRVTANARFPEPPLRLALDAPLVALGLAVYLVCAATLASLITWNAYRRAT